MDKDEGVRKNVFEEYYTAPSDEYQNLTDVIDFEGFDFDSRTYLDQEIDILEPRLKVLGYTEIRWLPGETDSFGPLTRVCKAVSPSGKEVTFFYG